jgi:hypothetical protein
VGRKPSSDELPERHDAHVGEEASFNAVRASFSNPLFIVRREADNDYGVDLHLEALENEGKSVSNFRAQAQVKASNKEPRPDGSYSYPVFRKNLNYLLNGGEGLYLFYSRRSDELYYEWASTVWAEAEREEGRTLSVRFTKRVDPAAVRAIWARIVELGKQARSHRFGDAVKPPPAKTSNYGEAVHKLVRYAAGKLSLPGESQPIDLRLKDWPVRDQGHEPTSVACALAACVEHLHTTEGGGGSALVVSEQVLYWAAKRTDPLEGEGILLADAAKALEQIGVCSQAEFSALEKPLEPRNAGRLLELAARRRYRSLIVSQGTTAREVYVLLQVLKRPVALSLAVFYDHHYGPVRNNWNSFSAQMYGRIMEPPPGALSDFGQAVCVTGFVPDSSARGGGYFVFRNSWGPSWARNPDNYPAHSPEPGYGYVSANYVDRYAWEFCCL